MRLRFLLVKERGWDGVGWLSGGLVFLRLVFGGTVSQSGSTYNRHMPLLHQNVG